MSLEAWGDEGSVAIYWKDTLIRSELDEVIKRFDKWNRDNGNDMPNPEFADGVCRVRDELLGLRDMLTGRIDL